MAGLCVHCTQEYGYCRFLEERAGITNLVAQADKTNPGKVQEIEQTAKKMLGDSLKKARRRRCSYVPVA